MLMAQVHEFLMRLNDGFELRFGDKDMHFIIMALMGMGLFFIVHFVFKRLAKWSITAISFIYVFTVMTVLGFAIEIGQKISGTGEMDFADIVAGLYGVLLFFAVYTAYRLLAMLCGWAVRRVKARRLLRKREAAAGMGLHRRRAAQANLGGEKQAEEPAQTDGE